MHAPKKTLMGTNSVPGKKKKPRMDEVITTRLHQKSSWRYWRLARTFAIPAISIPPRKRKTNIPINAVNKWTPISASPGREKVPMTPPTRMATVRMPAIHFLSERPLLFWRAGEIWFSTRIVS